MSLKRNREIFFGKKQPPFNAVKVTSDKQLANLLKLAWKRSRKVNGYYFRLSVNSIPKYPLWVNNYGTAIDRFPRGWLVEGRVFSAKELGL